MSSQGRQQHRRRSERLSGMTLAQAFEKLDLPREASRREVRAAYHRLALQLHPDHNPDDAASLDRFKQLVAAYRLLESKFRAEDERRPRSTFGRCPRCGEHHVLSAGRDGVRCCNHCLTMVFPRRFLPLPSYVVATCRTTIVLLLLAFAGMALRLVTGEGRYALLSLGLGIAALMTLAITSISIVYTIEPRRARRRCERA